MESDIISAVALIMVAVIEVLSARDRKKSNDERARAEARGVMRAKESRLSMKLADANLELSLATALAVEQGKMDGEMTRARKKASEAQGAYTCFTQELTSNVITRI